jgi:hypothetical protein
MTHPVRDRTWPDYPKLICHLTQLPDPSAGRWRAA